MPSGTDIGCKGLYVGKKSDIKPGVQSVRQRRSHNANHFALDGWIMQEVRIITVCCFFFFFLWWFLFTVD